MNVPTQEEIDRIYRMSRDEMAHLWRFAPVGHPYFSSTNPLSKIFEDRFMSLGGMSPEISKTIGWES